MTSRWPSLLVFLVVACAAGADEAGLPTWGAELELEVGGAEEGPLSFSDIRSFAVDSAGTIYVLEAKEHEVRVFDAAGAFQRRIGRRGAGPGEFEQANGIALTPDGQVWVYSPATRRLVQFEAGGGFVKMHSPPVNSWGWTWTGGIDRDLRLFDVQFVQWDTSSVQRLVVTDLRAESTDTVALPDCPTTSLGYYAFPRGSMGIPFGSGQLQVVDPRGRIWCVDTRELRIHEYGVGEVVPARTLVAAVQGEPVTAFERDTAIAGIERFKERAGDANLDYSLIPQTKAIVEGITMDDAGQVWVRARTAAGFQLVVFGTDGAPTAVVPLPKAPLRWAPLVVQGDRVYFVATDADGVPSIVRYRVVR